MATTEANPIALSDRALSDLSGVLLAGLKALADAGEAEQACRLAGHACAALRDEHGAQWRSFNTLLHRLARRTGPVGTARPESSERSAQDFPARPLD